MPNYVYSTATCDGTYVDYGPADSNKNVGFSKAVKKVVIRGGHGVAQQTGLNRGAIYTPQGVMTQVSDEDLEFLENNKAFQRHKERGFIAVDKRKVDPEKHAVNMNPKDGSAPITPKDFELSESSTPETPIYKRKEEVAHETIQAPVKHKGKR